MQSGSGLLLLNTQYRFIPLPVQLTQISRFLRPSKARPGGQVYFTGVWRMIEPDQLIEAPVALPLSGPPGSHLLAVET